MSFAKFKYVIGCEEKYEQKKIFAGRKYPVSFEQRAAVEQVGLLFPVSGRASQYGGDFFGDMAALADCF